jgi:hypothetical protein
VGDLTFRITTIGAVCVGLDELPDSKAIRGFVGGGGNVFAYELVSVPQPDRVLAFGSAILNKTALSTNQGWKRNPSSSASATRPCRGSDGSERMRDQLVAALGLAAERARRAGSASEQRFCLLARGLRLHGGPCAGQT